MSAAQLQAAFAELQHGALWKAYARANPREAEKLAAYVPHAGTQAPPALATATGKGIAAIISAGFPYTPPSKPGTGLALYKLGGTLGSCSHLDDGTYDVLVGDWADAPLLAKSSGETYAYTVTSSGVNPAQASEFAILDPTGTSGLQGALTAEQYAAKCMALAKANPGLGGVFLDNCDESVGQLAEALEVIAKIFSGTGVKFAANVGSYQAGNPGSDDGSLWRTWAATIAPSLDRLMLENWQTPSDQEPPAKVRLRGTAWDEQWDAWQQCVAVAPGKLMCVTYGPAEFGVYGRASMLTAPGADPRNVFFNAPDPVTGGDPYGAAWQAPPSNPTVDPVAGTASLQGAA